MKVSRLEVKGGFQGLVFKVATESARKVMVALESIGPNDQTDEFLRLEPRPDCLPIIYRGRLTHLVSVGEADRYALWRSSEKAGSGPFLDSVRVGLADLQLRGWP